MKKKNLTNASEKDIYWKLWCKNPLPDITFKELVEKFKHADPPEAQWRLYAMNKVPRYFEDDLKRKIKYFSVGDFRKIMERAPLSQREDAQSILNYAMRRVSGEIESPKIPKKREPKIESPDNEVGPKKLEHFIIDHSEVELLLAQRNSRFSGLISDLIGKLKSLPPGKDHGFYPGTTEKKEISGMISAIHKSINKLGFSARYIKSKQAILIIRKENLPNYRGNKK